MKLLTVQEVAAQLQIDPSTVYRLVEEKKIIVVRWRARGPIRFRQEDIDAFVARSLVGAAEADPHTVARAALREVLPAVRRF